jgi:hypothetical protein
MAYNENQIKTAKDIIIDEMVDGKSLVSIIDSNKDIPRIRTVFNWLNPESDYHDAEFLHNYARAQLIRAEREFEEIKSIADSIEDDVVTDNEGNSVINQNVIQRDRLRVDARKWRISKMQPKKYGDKLDVTSDNKPLNESKVTLNIDGKNIKLE